VTRSSTTKYRAGRARRTLHGIDEQVAKAARAVAGLAPVKRNRFIALDGAVKSVNRELEAKTRTLAGIKGYKTNLAATPDGEPVTADFVISSYHELWRIEQGYKQVKDELGWADFQVRSDIAIRRHQTLVNCAFSFCWAAWFGDHPPPRQTAPPQPEPGRGERGLPHRRPAPSAVLAAGAARGPRLAFPMDRAAALVDRMVQGAPAAAAPIPDQLGRGRLRPAPLHPELTGYR
jgi:hypothetical protein